MGQRFEMRGGGTLTWEREGPRVRLEAVRPEDGRGLYKAWITGEAGRRMLLGTFAPENGRLCLRRVLPAAELERKGCWPPTGAEAVLTFVFSRSERWYCEKRPERLTKDPLLQSLLKDPMLCRKESDGFCLAAPFRPERPVALNTLFCLARLECLEGRPHLVWRFDGEGRPEPPHKSPAAGTDYPAEGEPHPPGQRRSCYAQSDDQGTGRSDGPAEL